ncbi:hypothetical protein CONCODRAFT_78213 [Conidiobolus coronatus NRRL 28638]|uniref:Phosphotransferase n=1 Tax=Conidiobolus coronatus (strain ATCC 28846 / CBS 209.66 / NRRL 28638) TaxID=796925 RepID=A0A137P9P8_CONC2|nr:hypothetical protein CONCODRAFT_78213 [Conidiobolus coronatus NRRL 28638]|eukprot:KXN71641.1 hypothetical protein CONCODRAFT_78213 [Conidiobolus coronatus NRRL 28638]
MSATNKVKSTPPSRSNSMTQLKVVHPTHSSPQDENDIRIPKDIEQSLNSKVDEVLSQFTLTTERLKSIQESFMLEMSRGLEKDGEDLPMIPTFVTGRPTGEEEGSYFAIDLGGSHLRVCLVHLKGPDHETEVIQRKFVVPEEAKTAEATHLFDFIAEHVESFLVSSNVHPPKGQTIPLGFTFSFPVNQTAINRGKLMFWNKGFTCPGAVGKDVVQLLQDALDRKQVNVTVSAMVNDTVGTLLSSAYKCPNTLAGVILGTGTNAAYYEKLNNLTKWRGDSSISEEMILNMEWGNFDTEKKYLPCTAFDNHLDRETQNPYQMVFEKMISGRYLGEIVRIVLIHLIDHRIIFNGRSTASLNTPYSFASSYLSDIHADETDTLSKTKHILEDLVGFPVKSTTLFERRTVQKICKAVGIRSARLSSAALAGLCAKRLDLVDEGVTIGVDGSLFEHYPNFPKYMKEALTELLGETHARGIELVHATDGSGIGAAMTAMIASQ